MAEDVENSIGVASGANGALSPADVKKAAKVIAESDILVMQLETPLPTVLEAAKTADKAGVPVILNPAPMQPLPEELLRKVTILTPNETEAESLTGITVTDKKTAEEAASILHRKGVPIVIITMGAKGVYLSAPECKKMIKSFKVKAVDSTAAGDVFNGALATALSQELGLLEAIRFAIAAAAISVTRLGAQPSVPTRKEIEKMLKS